MNKIFWFKKEQIKNKKDIGITAIIFLILSMVFKWIHYLEGNQMILCYLSTVSLNFSVAFFSILLFCVPLKQKGEKIVTLVIYVCWLRGLISAFPLVIVIICVFLILGGIEKFEDLIEFMSFLGISLIVTLIMVLTLNEMRFIEHLVINLQEILLCLFNMSLDIETASVFILIFLIKVVLDVIFRLFVKLKVKEKKQKVFNTNTLKKVELFMLLILFMVFIFEMFPNFDYAKYQGKVLNALTFFTIIMLYKDTRDNLTKRIRNYRE